jgi:SAM domain (Sterile alpha motif)
VQEIIDWLTRLGLPEHAGAFAENGIDVSVLLHLTDQDLKDIGVLLGHRRKILAAVAELPEKSPSASKPFPPVVEISVAHPPGYMGSQREPQIILKRMSARLSMNSSAAKINC